MMMNAFKRRYRLIYSTLLILLLVVAPAVPQLKQSSDRSVLRTKLEQYLQSINSEYTFSVLVAVDGDPILQQGYGWTDRSKAFRTTERTLFNIASITKSFTAISILQLEDKNKLRLDDTLPMYFTDVPTEKQPITILNLLTHTSGLGQNYASDGIADRDSAMKLILADSLQFSPGKGFAYSNENYELLGGIIEQVTGLTYEEYVRENILLKAKMNDTRFWAEAPTLKNNEVARKNVELAPETLVRQWGYIGSGGIYTTVVDLHRWFETLRTGKFVSPKKIEYMWNTHWQLTETGVGLGWYSSPPPKGSDRREIWTRGSESFGHNGVLRWFSDRKVLIIVLSNSGELGDKSITANRIISDRIVKIIFQ